MIRYLSRVQGREGDRILRTWSQLAKGLGLATEGLTDRQCRNRYRGSLYNTLDYLIAWGFLERREALYEPNGEGRCIVIVLPAGVAQSVRASRSLSGRTDVRSARPPARSSISPQVCTPRWGTTGGTDSRRSRELRTVPAEARERASSTRDRALAATQASAALAVALQFEAGEGGGVNGGRLLELRPVLAELPIEVVAREAWRLLAGAELPTGRGDCRLSLKMQDRLARASSQLERAGYIALRGPAASRAAVIDLAFGDWVDYWDGRAKPPATLGGLACCLSALARERVSGYRNRRDPSRAGRSAAWRVGRRT